MRIMEEICFLNRLTEELSEEDSLGRLLTKEQSNFFKRSLIKDAEDRLLVVYHGTMSNLDSNSFRSIINWFSSTRDYARSFADVGKNVGVIYECYLNVEKLFDAGDTDGLIHATFPITTPYTFTKQFKKLISKLEISEDEARKIVLSIIKNTEAEAQGIKLKIHSFTRTEMFRDLVTKLGYDGVECLEFGNKTFGVFKSNQIKSVENKSPTNDSNINK